MQQFITVRFTHPRKSSTFVADLSPQMTANQAILALLSPGPGGSGPFLPPLQSGQEYQLVLQRTGVIIPANATMHNAGVVNNDAILVILNMSAANLLTTYLG